MQQFSNKKHKLTAADVYGKLPVYKTMLRVALPAFLMSYSSALFVLINYYLLIRFMPITNGYSFINLFLKHDNVFNALLNNINNPSIHHLLFDNYLNYKNFLKYICLQNQLHFYNTADTIRIAVSLISPIAFLISAVPILLLPGSNVLFTDAISSRNRLKEIKVWQNEFYTSLLITICGMVLIVILNYAMIPGMIKDSLNENITPNLIHNINNNQYYFVNDNNTLIFLTYENNKYYNVFTNEVVALKQIHHFSIENNNVILAKVFSNYYHQVGNYGIKWAQNYIIIMTCFLWITNILYTNINLIRNYGRTEIIAIVLFIAILLNILLDYIFVYFADAGLNSSAIATVIAYSLSLIPLVIYAKYLYKKGIIWVNYWNLKWNLVMWETELIKEMFLICLSSIVKYLCYMIIQVLLINQIAFVTGQLFPTLGSLYFISIMGAVLPIMNFFYNPVSGFMATGTSLIGYNYGIKAYERIRKIVFESSLFFVIYGFLVLGIVGFVTPVSDFFLNIFGIQHEKNGTGEIVYESSRKFLWISLTIVPIRGIGNNGYMLTRTTKRYISAIMVALIRSLFIIVPFLYIFSAVAQKELIHIPDLELAKTNPVYNPNIWLLLWTQSSSVIAGNLIVIIWVIYFVYIEIHHEKTPFKNWKINKWIQSKYQNKILDEDKLVIRKF